MKSESKLHQDINRLITAGRFFEAIEMLRANDPRGATRAMVSECAATYRYMLGYFEQSTSLDSDPGRPAMVATVRENLRRAADALNANLRRPTDTGEYFTTMRNLSVRPDANITGALRRLDAALVKAELAIESDTYSDAVRREVEDAQDEVFATVWTTQHLSRSETSALHEMLGAPLTETAYPSRVLILTALLLGSLQYYDKAKLDLLLRISLKSEDSRLTARALCGALLTVIAYSDRITGDSDMEALLAQIADTDSLSKGVRKFVPLMLRTLDTERVSRKVNEDIFPQIMKLKPDLERKLKKLGENLSRADIEENPDWQSMLEENGFTDKLKELTDLQMDGADIFMSAFSHMKSFPFFRRVSNWFLPFDAGHTALHEVAGRVPDGLLQMLTGGNYFCSSDKYSMALALAAMPQGRFDMMNSQMQSQMDAMREEMKASESLSSTDMTAEMASYLKDLYRFYKLKGHGDTTPFEGLFEIPASQPFSELLTDVPLLQGMAEFYFKYGYWDSAIRCYDALLAQSEAGEDILQKKGYCLQMKGDDAAALEVYKQSELLNPASGWLLKRISTILRDMKRYDESADYARRALEAKPDNLALEMLLGSSLMLARKPEEALQSFYKIRYLKPENTKVLRPIAWCEFLLGNYDKSAEMYSAMPDMQPSDMLNCGHAQLAQGHVREAVKCYRSCVSTLGGDTTRFRAMIAEDSDYLTDANIDALSISLVSDLATATAL